MLNTFGNMRGVILSLTKYFYNQRKFCPEILSGVYDHMYWWCSEPPIRVYKRKKCFNLYKTYAVNVCKMRKFNDQEIKRIMNENHTRIYTNRNSHVPDYPARPHSNPDRWIILRQRFYNYVRNYPHYLFKPKLVSEYFCDAHYCAENLNTDIFKSNPEIKKPDYLVETPSANNLNIDTSQ